MTARKVPNRVYMADMRACKYCARGVRQFFIRHGFDWSAFLQDGIDADALAATGDAMAIRVADYVRR